jgi:hypothetical protein
VQAVVVSKAIKIVQTLLSLHLLSYSPYISRKIARLIIIGMAIRIVKLLLAVSLLCSMAFAAPVAGSVDGTGVPGSDANNPKDLILDVSGWPDQSEEDCYAILCLGKDRVM